MYLRYLSTLQSAASILPSLLLCVTDSSSSLYPSSFPSSSPHSSLLPSSLCAVYGNTPVVNGDHKSDQKKSSSSPSFTKPTIPQVTSENVLRAKVSNREDCILLHVVHTISFLLALSLHLSGLPSLPSLLPVFPKSALNSFSSLLSSSLLFVSSPSPFLLPFSLPSTLPPFLSSHQTRHSSTSKFTLAHGTDPPTRPRPLQRTQRYICITLKMGKGR